MSLNDRKRQKKAERRKAKQRKRTAARRVTDTLVFKLQRAAAAPVLHARVAEDLSSSGIGMAVLSRKLPDGFVAYAAFLVDTYCLGIKDIFVDIMPRAVYEDKVVEGLFEREPTVDYSPASLRKLVEGAAAYAESLGFPPPRDYAKARLIFGDIDVAASPESFTFGRDGKPFYVSGPYDSMEKSRRIIETLTERCGEGNFDYLLGLSASGGIPDLALSAKDNVLRLSRVVDFADDDLDDEYDEDIDARLDDDSDDDIDGDFDDNFDGDSNIIDKPGSPSRPTGILPSLAATLNPFHRRAPDGGK